MWQEKDNKLVKTFEFKDFTEAFGFMSKVAIEAEKMNHLIAKTTIGNATVNYQPPVISFRI